MLCSKEHNPLLSFLTMCMELLLTEFGVASQDAV